MIKWLSISVLVYLVVGISWWGLLLYDKNIQLYQLKLSIAENHQQAFINEEFNKQKMMIIGEGLFLGISILGGIFIVYRAARHEIQNMQQQSDFLLSVSHELKSPIAAIKLALQTLNRSDIPQQATSEIKNAALNDVDRLEQLVQNILLSASIAEQGLSLIKEPTEVGAFIQSIIEDFRKRTLSVEFRWSPNSEESTILIDRLMMRQAIANILQNAVKYSYPDTSVDISYTTNTEIVQIFIRNQGIGIAQSNRDQLFKRFYRSVDGEIRKKEGTGIGLYISNEIVKAHKGYIRVEGERDKYALFVVNLPRA